MSIIVNHTISELDKKIEYLLQEKSCVLEDELGMTKEVLRNIKSSCQTYYESKPLQKNSISKKYKPITILSMGIAVPVLLLLVFSNNYTDVPNENVLTSGYLIQNLKGDVIDTWNYWNIPEDRSLYVTIIGSNLLDADYNSALESAILSEEKVSFDKSLFNKVPKGTDTTYYMGWKGAMDNISNPTLYPIPSNFIIRHSESSQNSGDIIVTLTTKKSSEGLSGYTKSVLEENNILKSYITIYDADSLSKSQLSSIMRHEFGHAMGLAHSTAPDDLMAPSIITPTPYISECNVAAISSLYDGNRLSEVVCEI